MLILWFTSIFIDRGFQDTNVWQVTIALRVVEAVANNKFIWNSETCIVNVHRFEPLAFLIQ